MNLLIIIAVIVAFQTARGLFVYLKGRDITYLWVSFYLITTPLTFSKVIGNEADIAATGTLPASFRFTIPLLLAALLVFKSNFKNVFKFSFKNWMVITSLFIIISVFNPYNEDYAASISYGIFFVSNILFLIVIGSYISAIQLLKGLFDGLAVLCIIQLGLAICFPVLNIVQVTSMFHAADAAIGATRAGTREGAVGFFNHPGRLAIFTLIASSYFLSTYLYNYKKQISLILLIINAITLFLTYSRTSYVGIVILVVLLGFIKKNEHKNVFALQNILKFMLPSSLLIGYVIFLSPMSDIFLKGDSQTQVLNRTIHYKIGYKIFQTSPVVGVGLNAHVAYINKHPAILGPFLYDAKSDFYKKNPIHNIHLIILAETGLLGFIAWITFILRNIYLSARQIKSSRNQILSLSFIGVLVTISFYGLTGWSPFSLEILPFFFFFTFFAIKARA